MKFNPLLKEGVILSRRGQFVIFAKVDGVEQRCHCPTTGRVGNIDLANSLQNHQRAIMLLVFIYDNPGFRVIDRSVHYEKVKKTTQESFNAGVELWQANFRITLNEVALDKYFQVQVDTILQSSE